MINRPSLSVLLVSCLLFGSPMSRVGIQPAVTLSPQAEDQSGDPITAAPKFALLVGINRYVSKKVKPLNGCENDVDDIKGVLTTLFRFPDDKEHILTLKSEEAKKQRILDAFRSHLIGNASKYKDQKPTIVFYFSGHGSYVKDGPDQDEGDGFDETLVPHDRGVNNVTDIVDDELDGLFEELRQYTTNITFILDSCHSATATRAVDLQPRNAPPLNPSDARNEDGVLNSGSKDIGNAMLARRIDSYTTLSGCLPYQLSYEYTRTMENGQKRTNGVMTAQLVQALRLRPDATYRELGEMVRRAVEKEYTFQSPQAEGNLDRLVFEGADPNARNYIAVSAVNNADRTITIAAGKAQGVKKGTFIAVYAQKAKKLYGTDDKLADAEVIALKDFESVALLSQNTKPVAPNDKAVILTPGFGSDRLRVVLDTSMRASRAGADVIKEVQGLLQNDPDAVEDARDKRNPLVEVVATVPHPLTQSAGAEWDVAVVRDTFEQYKTDRTNPFAASKDTKPPSNKDEVYYITTREGNPLYEFFVHADAPDAAHQIIAALENRARQANVSTLSNSGSALRGQVTIRLLKVQVDSAGQEIRGGEFPATSEGVQRFKVGERFYFQIENRFSQKLFLTLIAINPSGSISILSTPEDFGGEVSPNTPVKSARVKTGLPTGKTVFKLMVTTQKVDFSFLGQPPLTRDARTKAVSELTHPFARLLGQAFFGATRDVGKDEVQGFDDWTTFDIDLVVSEL
jgi:hypothetical protein